MMKRKVRIVSLMLVILLLFLSGCAGGKIESQDDRMAKDYLGMTFGEIKELWGEDCTLGGDLYEGAEKGVCYANGRTPYIFLFAEEITDLSALSDDAAVVKVRALGGEGKPCEALENTLTRGQLSPFYIAHVNNTELYISDVLNIRDEVVSVAYYFPLISEEEKKTLTKNAYYEKQRNTALFMYEVYTTPEEYRQEQYYHDTDQARLGYFFTYGVFPNENWDGEAGAPLNFHIYYLDNGEWSDPDALAEFIETGVWPEDAYIPYPYDELERVYFKGEYGIWPPDNWDYLPIDSASSAYHGHYKEWPDPEAFEEFMETGHWPEDAYVPYPYNDHDLVQYYYQHEEWPEGTDLSQVPERKEWWEE